MLLFVVLMYVFVSYMSSPIILSCYIFGKSVRQKLEAGPIDTLGARCRIIFLLFVLLCSSNHTVPPAGRVGAPSGHPTFNPPRGETNQTPRYPQQKPRAAFPLFSQPSSGLLSNSYLYRLTNSVI